MRYGLQLDVLPYLRQGVWEPRMLLILPVKLLTFFSVYRIYYLRVGSKPSNSRSLPVNFGLL